MSLKTEWLIAVAAGGLLALAACRQSEPEDVQPQSIEQEESSARDEDPRDLSGGPEGGTGGAGTEGELMGGAGPAEGEGSEAQRELSGQESQPEGHEAEN